MAKRKFLVRVPDQKSVLMNPVAISESAENIQRFIWNEKYKLKKVKEDPNETNKVRQKISRLKLIKEDLAKVLALCPKQPKPKNRRPYEVTFIGNYV